MSDSERLLENESGAETLDKETAKTFSSVRALSSRKARDIWQRVRTFWKWDYEKLRGAEVELIVDLEMAEDDDVLDLPIAYGTVELLDAYLEKYGTPCEWDESDWAPSEYASLRGLTIADCWLVLASSLAGQAHHLLSGAAVSHGWPIPDSLSFGARFLMEANVSLLRAEHLYADRKATKALTQKASRARHAKTYEIRAKAISLYQAGTWKSRHDAAKRIYPDVASYADSLGVRMSDERGPRTIYEWLTVHSRTTRLRGDG